MKIKKIYKSLWFWLVILSIILILLFAPIFINCNNCYVFPDANGEITSHGRCCQSLINFILNGNQHIE